MEDPDNSQIQTEPEIGSIYKLKKAFKKCYPNRCYKHPFISLRDRDEKTRGVMLTTSNKKKYKNIMLQESWFESDYPIRFGKSKKHPHSFIAPLFLLKDIKFEHLTRCGKLTKEGVENIQFIARDLKYTDWLKYQKGQAMANRNRKNNTK